MTAAGESPRRRGRPPSGGREAILAATTEVLRERGIVNLTTREVAARAGVSEASVYYHFGDRPGLLKAVFEHEVKPLEFMAGLEAMAQDRRELLAEALRRLEHFFDEVIPVLHAAQADPELGSALAEYVESNDLGPHRGVTAMASYFRAEQAAGRIDAEVDVEAVATLVVDAAFSRAARRLMLQNGNERLPSAQRLLATINRLLDPAA